MKTSSIKKLLPLVLLPATAAWSLPQSSTKSLPTLSSVNRAATSKPTSRRSISMQSVDASDINQGDEHSPIVPYDYNWSIAALLMSAFLNLLGFTMAGPITPALGQHFGLTVGASFGSLTSAYPLGMLFGLFLWPTLSDRWGRPPVIAITLLGTGVGLAAQAYIVATHKTLWMFLLSRVITGSFAGSSPVSKAYLADVSIHKNTLSRNLAWRDAASTMAFLVGPMLGGIFLGSTASLSFVISLSSVASLLAALVVGVVVQEIRPSSAGIPGRKTAEPQSEIDSNDLISCPLGTSLWSGVATVCLVSFLFNVGDSTFHAFFATLLKSGNVSSSNIGLAYSILAAVSLGVSSMGTPKVMKKLGPVASCSIGLGAVATALLAIGSASNVVRLVLAAAAIYACGVPLYSPTIPTMLLRCVPPNRRGFILGLDGAINTVARILAPIVMGHIYKTHGPSAAFGLAGKATLMAAAVAVGKRVHVLRQERIQATPKRLN